MATFSLRNFGCRANQADGAALAHRLRQAGLTPAAGEAADWVVLNTCTVTAAADAEARRAIRQVHRTHPQARIAVTGCYAERAPGELRGLPGVEVVAGHAAKWDLAAQLLAPESLAPAPKLANLAWLETPPAGRTRAVVKVQEGCGRACSFCIIPRVRGASRSRPLGSVLREVATLVEAGQQEIVLSGINLGQWGRDLDPDLRLESLVAALLRQTALPRLRLSSVEPTDWSAALTALMAGEPRLARHAHLPLQSGSDAVLRRMRRRYRARDYAARVETLAAAVPLAAIGADVMTGFPGETAEEHAETLALLASLPLAYLHVFPYSERPGTVSARQVAAGRWQAVPAAVAAERARELRALDAGKRRSFLQPLVGLTLPAVMLQGGMALTDNYATVRIEGPAPAPGERRELTITASDGAALSGVVGVA
ncbi:MAG: MiaB/RimO family radical SAM methylthiotransferase [Terriglobales bacterium]